MEESGSPQSAAERKTAHRVLVTGAAGFIGSQLVKALQEAEDVQVCGTDVRPPAVAQRHFVAADLRDGAALQALFAAFAPTSVVHLASIVTPPAGMSRAEMHAIDVGGTDRMIDLCLQHGVQHLTVTTSGASYGYHADNPAWLAEDAPIRGNPEFAYSDHKRQIEARLAQLRTEHPALKLLLLRPGTILGANVNNQITALFAKPRVLGVQGSDSPFVFIWDEDVVAIVTEGVLRQATGTFNLAGDGAVSMRQIAQALGKPYVALPAWLLRGVLGLLHPLGLTQYGPEQVGFLQYRPVLSNARLKAEFGYTPRYTSLQALEQLLQAQPQLRGAR